MKSIKLKYATRLINHGPLLVVSSFYNEKQTFTPIMWNMPVEHEPPLVAVTISKENFVNKLIKKSKVFALNILEKEYLDKVIKLGEVSGKDVDKIKLTGFHIKKCKKINSNYIKEAIGILECELYKTIKIGDVDIFIGKVVYCIANEKFKNNIWSDEIKTIHHIGSLKFVTTAPVK